VRVFSTENPNHLQNVAYLTPDGKKVLIVLNDTGSAQTFAVAVGGMNFTTTLNGGAVGTYIW
jgi:glucosylceramidase